MMYKHRYATDELMNLRAMFLQDDGSFPECRICFIPTNYMGMWRCYNVCAHILLDRIMTLMAVLNHPYWFNATVS